MQITKGLSGGETVIVNGAYGLPDNTQVKIAAAEQSSPEGAEDKTMSWRERTSFLDRRVRTPGPADDRYWFTPLLQSR